MSAYYNEHDPFAAAWLRELISDNLIAPGEVDERSIEDVTPDDLRPFRQCHFFAGVGVWSLAARLVGIDDDAPLWSGSCPCQPFSAAGKGEGFADERHLWPAFHYLVEQSSPFLIVGEQVAGADGDAWLDLVSADMEATGYAFGAAETVACGFGAPHKRTRNYWVAHSELRRRQQQPIPRSASLQSQEGEGGLQQPRNDGSSIFAMADRERSRLEGLGGHGDDGHEPGRERALATGSTSSGGELGELVDANRRGTGALAGSDSQAGKVSAGKLRANDGPDLLHGTSPIGGMADADGWIGGDRDAQPSGQFGFIAQNGGSRGPRGRGPQSELARRMERPGPVNGFWRDADWLRCRDEKWRPVEPTPLSMADARTIRERMAGGGGEGDAFTFPLAEAGTFKNRVGLLRGAGNAITIGQAAGFLRAVRQSLDF